MFAISRRFSAFVAVAVLITGVFVPSTACAAVPENIGYKGVPVSISYQGLPENIGYKGLPENIGYKGLPSNIGYKGIPTWSSFVTESMRAVLSEISGIVSRVQ